MSRSEALCSPRSTSDRGAADDFIAGGHPERAAVLRAEATVLADLLGDV